MMAWNVITNIRSIKSCPKCVKNLPPPSQPRISSSLSQYPWQSANFSVAQAIWAYRCSTSDTEQEAYATGPPS